MDVIDGSLHFTRSPAVDLKRQNTVSNRGSFTLSCWVKNSTEYDYTYLLVYHSCYLHLQYRELRMDIYDVTESKLEPLTVKSETTVQR